MSPEEWLASQNKPEMSPEQWMASQEPKQMGLIESARELITGTQRATQETQTLPEWTRMPELNQLSVASLKTGAGTLLSNPQETVQILQANFPGVQVRQDAKGNFILRSSVDQQEYAIPPGFSMGDIPRAVGTMAAFTPAGRALTIPGAIATAGLTQAGIEATQAATGGEFNPKEVGMAAATGPIGQVIQRVAPPAWQAAKNLMGGRPVPAPRVEPAMGAIPSQAMPEQTIVQAADQVIPQVMPQAAAEVAGDVNSVLNLARQASGGPGSTAARAKLAELAQVNQEARAAAERLGMDLPFDVFSDNPQVRSAVGLTRALVGGEAESAWESTVRQVIQRADEVAQEFDAAFIGGRPSTGATSQRILDNLNRTQSKLAADAKTIYDQVDLVIPKQSTVQFPKLTKTLDDILTEVGERGLTKQEKALYDIATDPNVTYGRLLREKNLIGQALDGKESTYGNMDAGTLKRLYAALAEDQLTNVGKLGGEELRRQLRSANLLTSQKKALEKRMIGAFGKEIDGSVAQRMQTAISTASKGDAAAFNRLMKVVPKDLQRETVATALAQVTSGKAAGRAAGAAENVFSPTEYTKVYRGLRSNPPVYAQMVKIMGKEWDSSARDLYEISRRVADAQARIPTTGKANQILGSAAVDGLMSKVMSSGITQRAVTGVVGHVVPGGGAIAPDIAQWMASAKGSGVQKASKLFASPEFQELAIQTATQAGQPSASVIRKAAMSKAFGEFAEAARLPKSLDARLEWLQSAMQTGRQFYQENQ